MKKRSINGKQLFIGPRPVILALIAIPIVIGSALKLPWFDFNNGSNDGWLGFWGGYLASVITIVGVYWQVRKQINADKTKDRLAKRPTYIALRYNWNINSAEKIALFNDVASPQLRKNTKNFTDTTILKNHTIPTLINATSHDLYNVIIFGTFERYTETENLFDSKLENVDSTKRYTSFPNI
ncbi:hypothetical protein IWT140_01050 [Secundilactobacillus pentosiphilus]|uniref:Uncharacterized protein n=1 Tax=Secundilactobacillus pentosiphilus TaxID=1714682 RepID=A0A1Z5INW4_9LACO|nr:hypothetical protein [Secundilactobacillus pentosiphilus]GAX03447.1 hypothetical protein IWT140_01050 [Secundilactobacillus pentosiphilus]